VITAEQARLIKERVKEATGQVEDYQGDYGAELWVEVDEATIARADAAINHAARDRTVRLLPLVNATRGTSPDLRALEQLLGGRPRAHGGLITGPGGPTADQAGLFALSAGEYVVRAAAVQHLGLPFLDALNSLDVAGMSAGGAVPVSGVQSSIPMPRQGGAVHVNVTLSPGMNDRRVMSEIMRGIRAEVHHNGGSVQTTLGGRNG
jgi:hypothetical protein